MDLTVASWIDICDGLKGLAKNRTDLESSANNRVRED